MRPLSPPAVNALCALVAAVVSVVTQVASRMPAFHPSLLLNVANTDPIAPHVAALDPSFQFTSASDHYDGVYLLAMAQDPLALGQAHDLIDLAAYRYGHPLYSWIAGLLSAGQPVAMPWVFWLLSVLSMAGAAWGVSRLCQQLGASPRWGLLVPTSPGLLFSASTALTEPFQVALVCAILLVWLRPKPGLWPLAALSIALCLAKEQLVLVPLALGITLLPKLFRKGSGPSWARAAALLAGPVALGGWLLYVRSRFTAEQKHYDDGNLGLPLQGWFDIFQRAGELRVGEFHASQIGSTAVPGLIAIASVMVIGAVIGLRRRDALGWVVALQALLISALGWRTLLYPHEMFRIPSLALILAWVLIVVELTRGPVESTSP